MRVLRLRRRPRESPGRSLARARKNMHTGKPMDTNQSHGQTDAPGQSHAPLDDSTPDFGRRNPLEIGVQLRNLVNRGDFLTVEYAGGQLVTRLLEVDVRGRTFTFYWGALSEQNRGLLAAPRCQFHASPDGVRVEFVTATPR
jgi:hypothetical protein